MAFLWLFYRALTATWERCRDWARGNFYECLFSTSEYSIHCWRCEAADLFSHRFCRVYPQIHSSIHTPNKLLKLWRVTWCFSSSDKLTAMGITSINPQAKGMSMIFICPSQVLVSILMASNIRLWNSSNWLNLSINAGLIVIACRAFIANCLIATPLKFSAF